METVSRSGLLLWDRTALKSVRSGPASLSEGYLGSQGNLEGTLVGSVDIQSALMVCEGRGCYLE